MALDKRQHAVLYDRCRGALGDEAASLLMNELPPNGWEDVATKQDVERLDNKIDHKIEVLEHKLTAVFERGLRSQTKWIMVGNGGLVALATFLARLG